MQFKEKELKMERFWVSQVGLIIKDNKILILKESQSNFWVFPGGRADLGENGEVAFARELKEEINIDNYKRLAVVDYDLWYTENRKIPVCSIANLVDIGDVSISLSEEHSESKWIQESEVDNYIFAWPKAKAFITKAFELNRKLN
jgi:8-oxo-dGTP pyrophosphatase MutT (NUDIX family)